MEGQIITPNGSVDPPTPVSDTGSDGINQPASAEVPQPQPPEIKPPAPKKKKLAIVIVAILLILIAAGAWFVFGLGKQAKAPDQPNINKVANKVDDFSPRFDSVSAFVHFGDVDWYATPGAVIALPANGNPVFYTSAQGLPYGSPSSLVVAGDKLWVASMDGIAVLKSDGSGFDKTVTKTPNLANAKIFYDKYGKQLYLSTFKGFYTLNKAGNGWNAVAGAGNTAPMNISSISITSKFMVATGSGQGNRTWIYNRTSGQWSKNMPNFEDQSQSSFIHDGQILLTGRNKGYDSCASKAKVTATGFYKLDSNGKWQSVSVTTSDGNKDELNLNRSLKGNPVTFETLSCDGTTSYRYTPTLSGNKLELKSQGKTQFSGMSSGNGVAEQTEMIKLLASKTKLQPYIKVRAVDGAGNVIFLGSDRYDFTSQPPLSKLYIANGANLRDTKQIAVAAREDSWSTVEPILCDGKLSYVFTGVEEGSEGGPTGNWVSAKLLKVDGLKTTAFVDLGKDLAYPEFNCKGDNLAWLGRSSFKKLSLGTKKITTVGSNVGSDISIQRSHVIAAPNGNLWALVNKPYDGSGNASSNAYFANVTKANVQKFGNFKNAQLAAAGDNYAWIRIGYVSANMTLETYNTAGKLVFSQKTKPIFEASALPNDKALLFRAIDSDDFQTEYTADILGTSGSKNSLDISKMPIRQLSGGIDAYYYEGSVVDNSRKLVWVSDDQFGVFSVPIK